MALPEWWPNWVEPAGLIAGGVAVWALALYVITRSGWHLIPVLAALAMAALVAYQGGIALSALAPQYDTALGWLRATWAGPATLPALWLLLTAALAADEAPEALRPLFRRLLRVWAVLAPALGLFFASGSVNTLVRNWGGRVVVGAEELPASTPGPLYPLYVAYVVVFALVAMGNLGVMWRLSAPGTPLRARFRWLLVTGGLFVAGGGYLSYAAGAQIASATPGHIRFVTDMPGQALLLAGMVIMGWSIARYGALLAGEVTGDFFGFAVSLAAVAAIYTAAWLLIGSLEYSWIERMLPLLLLVLTTHVLADRRTPAVERLLYGPVAGLLQSQLRQLAARVVRQPDLPSAIAEIRESADAIVRAQELRLGAAALEAQSGGEPGAAPEAPAGRREWAGDAAVAGGTAGSTQAAGEAAPATLRVLVEGALRHLNDVPALSQHLLLEELPGAGGAADAPGTALDRAARLRTELGDAIGRLRPPESSRPTPGSSAGPGGWLHYLVLHEAYVEGRPNKQIMQRYHLSEGTFHRARRRAIDAITLDLYQRARVGRSAAAPGEPMPAMVADVPRP